MRRAPQTETVGVVFLVLVCVAFGRPADAGEGKDGSQPRTVRVSEEGDGRFAGTTGEPIGAAIEALRGGGVVEVARGVYRVRQAIRPPDGITIRGTDAGETVLRLPPPTVTSKAAAKGDRELRVEKADGLVAGGKVEILPPKDGNTFSGTDKKSVEARVESVGDGRLKLAEPLPVDVPTGSRVGSPHHLFAIAEPTKDVTIEGLTLLGGRKEGIPMPGHAKRCAVWAASPYTYADGPQAPPIRKLRVRHCVIRGFYGRGVAMYNVTDSAVVGCRIASIADQAIDFDHFNERCRAEGNVISDAVVGVTLNDASACKVRHNRIRRCETGINLWWWHKVSPEGVNEDNVIEHNVVSRSAGKAITLGKRCRGNTVRYNFVGGPVHVAEEDNVVHHNTPLERERSDDGS